MSKWRTAKIKTIPRQLADVQDRLDELIMGGTGVFGVGGSAGIGSNEDQADVSPNLIQNPGFEDWTGATCDYWQSAAANDWAAALKHYAQESTIVYSLPYSVKLGDGSNGSRGIAQQAAFRVILGEAYYLSVRLIGADATVEYAVILKALQSDGVTEITTGTPLGDNWTYSAGLGGWYIAAVAGTDWCRVTAPILLGENVRYLRASIQYYRNGGTKYLYADDFAITRGSQCPAFSYYYLTTAIGGGAHKLLSVTHSDTLPDDVAAGDILIGNSTPKWARFPKGANGQGLILTSGLPSWSDSGGSTNLVFNGAFDFWAASGAGNPYGWFSAVGNAWEDAGAPQAQRTTTAAFVYSLPYSVRLGAGSGRGGIAQSYDFPVVPSESYWLSARILGMSGTFYAICLRAYDAYGVEITSGTPLGVGWAYNGTYGAWTITGATSTSFQRITSLLTLDTSVCFLRASIQYDSGGAIRYIYLDDFAITRGAGLPPFTDHYVTAGFVPRDYCFAYFMQSPHGHLIPAALAGQARLTYSVADDKVLYNGAELNDRVSGSGTTNYIPKWNGAKSLTDSGIADDGTDIIHTSNRYHIFRVAGSANYRAAIYSDGSCGIVWSERTLEMDYNHGAPGNAAINTVRLYFGTDKKLYYKDDAGLVTGPIVISSGFAKGSGFVTFSNTPGSVDVTTGLASVAGALATFDYDMGDGVSITVRPNVPSAGKIRIWGRNVSGSGLLTLTVYWIAW